MTKKAIVFGSNGMSGHIISDCLKVLGWSIYNVEINYSSCSNIDIDKDKAGLDIILNNNKDVDCVISVARYLVKQSEQNITDAIYVNSWFPHYLERYYKDSKTKIIHLSTDCVFSGFCGNYKERDNKDGIGNYAVTKSLGEIINKKDLTIRTAIIGPEIETNESELFDWFMKQTGDINGYSNAFCSGLTTLELAKFISQIIDNPISGIYHLCNDKKISKIDLLKLIKIIWKKNDVNIKDYELTYSVDKSLVNTRTDYKYTVPSYQKMFEELKQYMDTKKDTYKY